MAKVGEMEAFFELPERAIRAFEGLSGLRVTVHDLTHDFRVFLGPERFQHRQSLCVVAKLDFPPGTCESFDIDRLRVALAKKSDGVIKICPAGLAECAVPLNGPEGMVGVLFAGLMRPKAGWRPDLVSPKRRGKNRFSEAAGAEWPEVDEAQAQLFLESLRQLAARILAWMPEARLLMHRLPSADIASRRGQILRFLNERHHRPVGLEDLAAYLHLSPSRAGHAVKEEFGDGFLKLLNGFRLRRAAGLLRHSGLSISQIAQACGFETAHFHRFFKTKMGMTPGHFRRRPVREEV